MKIILNMRGLAAWLVFSLVGCVCAQEGAKPAQTVDPFAASPQLQAVAVGGFTATGSKGLPKMKMCGYLKGEDDEALAMLSIDGGSVHIVREGDTVGLQELGKSTVIRIVSISRSYIEVQSGTLEQTVRVR